MNYSFEFDLKKSQYSKLYVTEGEDENHIFVAGNRFYIMISKCPTLNPAIQRKNLKKHLNIIFSSFTFRSDVEHY